MEAFFVSVCVFFFKQKTAYEMRISDWSSDVCSSDLDAAKAKAKAAVKPVEVRILVDHQDYQVNQVVKLPADELPAAKDAGWADDHPAEIGRASCRERVCQYV